MRVWADSSSVASIAERLQQTGADERLVKLRPLGRHAESV